MIWELVIIYDTGEKEVHPYTSKEKAEEIEHGMRKALGKQIEFSCVRVKYAKTTNTRTKAGTR